MIQKLVYLLMGVLFVSLAVSYLLPVGVDPHQEMFNNWLYLVFPLIAFIAGLYATFSYGLKNPTGRALLLFSLGILAFFIGEVLWLIFEFVLFIDPYPSVADLFYLLGYPLFFIATVLVIKSFNTQFKYKPILLIVGLLLTIIVIYFGIYSASESEATFMENLVAVIYGVVDLILIISTLALTLLTLQIRKGLLFKGWVFIFAAVFSTLVADLLFSVSITQYEEGVWLARQIDLLWTASYLFFAIGLLRLGFIVREIQKRLTKGWQKDFN